MVGLIPLFAVETLEPEQVDKLEGFKRRMQWFVDNRPDLADHVVESSASTAKIRRLLSIVTQPQLPRVLRFMLDEAEFLSPARHPRPVPPSPRASLRLRCGGMSHRVGLRARRVVLRALRRQLELAGSGLVPGELSAHRVAAEVPLVPGRGLQVECPSGSGVKMDLWQISVEPLTAAVRIFLRAADGRRPVYGPVDKLQRDPHWRDLVPFHEYFHAETGSGPGRQPPDGLDGAGGMLIAQSGE